MIFVGEVVNLDHSERAPLIFHGGRYGMVIKKEAEQPAPTSGFESSLSPDDLIYDVSRVFYQVRHDAQAERQRRGWTDPEYAALSVLGRDDGRTIAEIDALGIYRGQHVTPEVIAGLVARGLVSAAEPIGPESRVHLTPAGRKAIIEIIAMIKAAEADALEGFDFSEIRLLKQMLRRMVERRASAGLRRRRAARRPN